MPESQNTDAGIGFKKKNKPGMTIILGIPLLPITQKKCVIPAERSECRNLKTQIPVLVSKGKTKPGMTIILVIPLLPCSTKKCVIPAE